jgi:hypothetical protein
MLPSLLYCIYITSLLMGEKCPELKAKITGFTQDKKRKD